MTDHLREQVRVEARAIVLGCNMAKTEMGRDSRHKGEVAVASIDIGDYVGGRDVVVRVSQVEL